MYGVFLPSERADEKTKGRTGMDIKEMRAQTIEAASDKMLLDVTEILRDVKERNKKVAVGVEEATRRILEYLSITIPTTAATAPFIAAAVQHFTRTMVSAFDDNERRVYDEFCKLNEHAETVVVKVSGGEPYREEAGGNDGK